MNRKNLASGLLGFDVMCVQYTQMRDPPSSYLDPTTTILPSSYILIAWQVAFV